MNILTVCLDPEFVRVLADMLAADGLRVDARASVADAQRPGAGRYGALVIDGRPAGAEIAALVSNLRAAARLGAASPVVVVGDRADAPLRGVVDRIPAAVWMPRPASLLDLADALRRAAARAHPSVEIEDDEPAPAAPARPAWHPDNCRAVARWWARRASGSVTLDGAGEWHLSLGGPVGAGAMHAAERALTGGGLALEPGDVPGPGDRAALAALLWRAAVEAVGPTPAADWVPSLTALSERVGELPLSAGTTACLPRVGGADTVEAIARAGGVPLADVARDFAVLAFLGLVGRQERPGARSAPSHAPLPPRSGSASREVVSDPLSTPSVQRYATAPPRITSPVVERPFGASPPARPLGATSPVVPRAPASTAPIIERPFGASAPSRPSGERTGDPPSGAYRHESVDDPITSPTSSRMPVQRLRREAATLREADPWTVLGLPRRSQPETIRFTAARMKHRYQILDQDPDPEVRTLAAEVLARVTSAESELLAMKEVLSETPVDDWIRRGTDELARREWARAERCFSMAREAKPDDSLALAHLGWARFHNPTRPKSVREDEGKELITLALQFDGECAQAWRYLGEVAALRGDVDRARQCFNSAARIDPSFAVAKAR